MESKKTILITGANGFVAKNLISILGDKYNILKFDIDNNEDDLREFCKKSSFVFHFASIQRPKENQNYDMNLGITTKLLNILVEEILFLPVFFSSSIQAEAYNDYGRVKVMEENAIINYGKNNNVKTYVFRFNNLFGKYSKPNYTSVVTTFCYNTINGLPLQLNNPGATLYFSFVEDAINEVLDSIDNEINYNKVNYLKLKYQVSLGELAYYVGSIKNNTENLIKNNDEFFQKLKKVYSWYEENKIC